MNEMLSPSHSSPTNKYEFFKQYLSPLEVAATDTVKKFLKIAFVESGLVRNVDAEPLLDVHVKFTPEDGNECDWIYGREVGGSVCRGVCGRYDPGGGIIEVFLGCVKDMWFESFTYTILHLLVHHLQARTENLTLTGLTAQIPVGTKVDVDISQEIEATYLAKLFLHLSKIPKITTRDLWDYSRIWRPLIMMRTKARLALLSKEGTIDREIRGPVENPFRLVRFLAFELRDLRPIASVSQRNAGFRVYMRNILGIEVETGFESLHLSYSELCFTSNSGRLSVCYEGNHWVIPGEGFAMVFQRPMAVNLRGLKEILVSYDPPKARVLMKSGEDLVETEASLILVGSKPRTGGSYDRREHVEDVMSRIRSSIELPRAACRDGLMELPIPRPITREPFAEVPTLDLSVIRLTVSEEICPPTHRRIKL